jgi:hypothetical protein
LRRLLLAVLILGLPGPLVAAEHRLSVTPSMITVETRLLGDADGETRVTLPAGAGAPRVSGGRIAARSGAAMVLTGRTGARITLRYTVAMTPVMSGRAVFPALADRHAEPATLAWSRLPKDWRAISDLEGAPAAEADLARAILMVGPNLTVVEDGAGTRVATHGDPTAARRMLVLAAPVLAANRAYWRREGPSLIALTAPPPASAEALADSLARTEIERLGAPWVGLAEALTEVLAVRLAMRAGALDAPTAILRLDAADRPDTPVGRLTIWLLRLDDEVRAKTTGKADLDDVLLRMRQHHDRFAPGAAPDLETALVSAVWVIAGLDIRPDLARHGAGGQPVPLPETLYAGCLIARVTVAPAFDAGFDVAASQAAKAMRGVKRRGPAWNAGLRDGMRLDALKLSPGDTTREVEATTRPARGGRARMIRFWPYGDAVTESRALVAPSRPPVPDCARRLAGL